MKFYNPDEYRRKADQHWEMAGCARRDNDDADAQRHTKLAWEWMERARQGGYHTAEKTE